MIGTTSALPLPTATSQQAAVSRFTEFLLVGGATLPLFPLSWLLQNTLGLDSATFAAGFATFYAAYVINDPHFCVTYLLFYRDVKERAFGATGSGAQRLRYCLAGFVGPAVLVGWAGWALTAGSAVALGWMIQLMFLLVGWHYVKQGFGLLSVLAARHGTPLRAWERKLLLIHCFAGWGYAWASPAVARGTYEEKGVVYWAVAKPEWLEFGLGGALATSTLALAWLLITNYRRERRTLPALPLLAFLITIWSWTIYSSFDPFVQYLIPALHSLQYLYFVALMKGNQARAEEGPPHFGRPLAARMGVLALSALGLGWLLLHATPTFLDEALATRLPAMGASSDLGATPFFAAFFVIVNIHHYLMDTVIWRRDNPETRYLKGQSALKPSE